MAWKKFSIGDQVFFDIKTNKHYPAHYTHKGKIISMKVHRKISGGKGTRIMYEMECECGSILHPQADHLSLYNVINYSYRLPKWVALKKLYLYNH